MTTKIVNIAMIITIIIGVITFGFLMWKFFKLMKLSKEAVEPERTPISEQQKNSDSVNPERVCEPVSHSKNIDYEGIDDYRSIAYAAPRVSEQQKNTDSVSPERVCDPVSYSKNIKKEINDNRSIEYAVTSPCLCDFDSPISDEYKTVLMYPGSTGIKSFARLRFIKIADISSKRVEFLIKKETTLGRSVKEDISLDDRYISRHHAVFIFEGTVLKIMDTESANGTFLNGQKMKKNTPVVIQSKALVTMGATSFLVEKL